ncbi:FtsK/SpoIIIE domain-containing protein [Auritidibacter ignavus]|uniref:FtsK/SpoIIIE domain-containing protein n=1 Tax=Auritidibacter ignavus TaxID=678932 RepID=UPI0015D5B01F|nr:FtsK/SpoIIIE domain-containing protein [Auritidibacter ignavus]
MLQLVMAASPMIIGLVMMVVTGMWYFLLFSAISVIVAVVMISQYRAKRRKFIATITRLSTEQGQHRLNETYSPDQLRFALRSIAPDPLGLLRPHLATPTIRWGDGVLAVKLVRSDADEKWARHTQVHTAIAQHLAPGSTTVVRGLPEQLAPVTHWLLAQCHHHAAATQQRVWVHTSSDGDHELADSALPSAIVDTTGTLTRDNLDQKFARTPLVRIEQVDDNSPRPPASPEVVFDVSDGSVSGLDQAVLQIDFFGVSAATLDLVTSRLLTRLPTTNSHSQLMSVPSTLFTDQSTGHLRVEIDARGSTDPLDLVTDGPHLLITGTTGSGKSELFLTVLTQLAMTYPADQVSMVLLDFKGGSSFAVLEDLPHVMAVETNLSAGVSLRSLGAIEAELLRREKLFAEYRVSDYASFRQWVPHVALPRLVVAIDELKMLIEDHRQAQDVLVRLAATGRSLGFHLVLATQRAQGTVTSDVRANLGTVLCLRTATEQDSWDLIGDASAYRITASQPGRGILRRGPADSEIFQTPIMRLPSEPVTLTPVSADRPVSTKTVATTKWPRVVSMITEAHEQAGLLSPDPIVLPSLPEHWSPSGQSTGPLTPTSGMILGLVDHPTERMQAPIWWNPKTSSSEATPQSGRTPWILTDSLAVIGASGSGAETLLDRAVTEFFTEHHRGRSSSELADNVAIFDGRPHREESSVERAIHITESSQNRWSFHAECSSEELDEGLVALREILQDGHHLTIIIRHFSAWASRIPGRGFESFEDRLMTLIRDFPNTLRILIHGGRELAAGRTVGLITDRIYLGFGSTEEHRMVWPRLRQTPHIPYRGVLVGRGWPVQGLEIQLAE